MKKKVMWMVILFAMISTFMLNSVQPKNYIVGEDEEIELHEDEEIELHEDTEIVL